MMMRGRVYIFSYILLLAICLATLIQHGSAASVSCNTEDCFCFPGCKKEFRFHEGDDVCECKCNCHPDDPENPSPPPPEHKSPPSSHHHIDIGKCLSTGFEVGECAIQSIGNIFFPDVKIGKKCCKQYRQWGADCFNGDDTVPTMFAYLIPPNFIEFCKSH